MGRGCNALVRWHDQYEDEPRPRHVHQQMTESLWSNASETPAAEVNDGQTQGMDRLMIGHDPPLGNRQEDDPDDARESSKQQFVAVLIIKRLCFLMPM